MKLIYVVAYCLEEFRQWCVNKGLTKSRAADTFLNGDGETFRFVPVRLVTKSSYFYWTEPPDEVVILAGAIIMLDNGEIRDLMDTVIWKSAPDWKSPA